MENSILLYIVGGFLLLNLAIGFFAGRNVSSFEDYAFGEKKWSFGAIVMGYLATAFSGSNLLRGTNDFYTNGLYAFAPSIGVVLSSVIKYFLISKNICNYKNCVTLGGVSGAIYGKSAQFFVGLLSGIYGLIILGMQIEVLGYVFQDFLLLKSDISLYLSVSIIGLYTLLGGGKSIGYLGTIQFVFILASLFVLSSILVNNAGGLSLVLSNVVSKSDYAFKDKYFSYALSGLLVQSIFSVETFEGPQFQKMLLNRSRARIVKFLLFISIGWIVYSFLRATIAFSVFTLGMEFEGNIILYVFQNILPINYKPFIAIGLISFILSSADGFLYNSGLSLYLDCILVISKKTANLKFVRILTLIICITSLIFAKMGLSKIRLDYILGILAPTFCAPLLLGISGLKSNSKAFWGACILGLSSFFILKFNLMGPELGKFATLIASLLNLCFFTIYSLTLVERKNFLINTNVSRSSYKEFFQKPKRICLNLIERLGNEVIPEERYLFSFAIIYSFYIIMPSFISLNNQNDFNGQLLLKFIALLFCGLILTKNLWHENLRKYFKILWYLTLSYCLIFLGSVMIMMKPSSIEYLINIAVCIMLILVLVDWLIALLLSILGVLCASYTVNSIFLSGINNMYFNFSTKYLLIYQIALGVVLGVLFARRKDMKIKNFNFNTLMLKSFQTSAVRRNQESLAKLSEIKHSYKNDAIDPIEEIEKLEQAFISKDFETLEREIQILKNHIYVNSIEVKPYYILNAQSISLKDFAFDCEKLIRSMGIVNIVVEASQTDTKLTLDRLPILKVIWNIVQDFLESKQINNDEDIYLSLNFNFSILKYFSPSNSSYIREIDAIVITVSQDGDLEDDMIKIQYENELIDPKKIPYVDLNEEDYVDSQTIIDAHYGVLKNLSAQDTFIWQAVIPVDIYSIRPETLDLKKSGTSEYIWPEAIALENKFLHLIKENHSDFNIDYIKKAIEMIKVYHAHQIRKSGEPYYMHPINVAIIALEILEDREALVYNRFKKGEQNIILAALLHDILEDTSIHPVAIGNIFGKEVLEMVKNVTKIDFEERGKLLTNEQAFVTLIDQEPEVICIKIADRIHNLQTIDGHPKKEKRIAVAEETLMFFTRAAKKYGMTKLAEKLTSMCNYIIKNGKIEGFAPVKTGG